MKKRLAFLLIVTMVSSMLTQFSMAQKAYADEAERITRSGAGFEEGEELDENPPKPEVKEPSLPAQSRISA
jgi:hypothetical protein